MFVTFDILGGISLTISLIFHETFDWYAASAYMIVVLCHFVILILHFSLKSRHEIKQIQTERTKKVINILKRAVASKKDTVAVDSPEKNLKNIPISNSTTDRDSEIAKITERLKKMETSKKFPGMIIIKPSTQNDQLVLEYNEKDEDEIVEENYENIPNVVRADASLELEKEKKFQEMEEENKKLKQRIKELEDLILEQKKSKNSSNHPNNSDEEFQ